MGRGTLLWRLLLDLIPFVASGRGQMKTNKLQQGRERENFRLFLLTKSRKWPPKVARAASVTCAEFPYTFHKPLLLLLLPLPLPLHLHCGQLISAKPPLRWKGGIRARPGKGSFRRASIERGRGRRGKKRRWWVGFDWDGTSLG